MAFLVKEKRQQADYVNYEQQAPNRDIHYRQANMGVYQQPYYPQEQPQYDYNQPQYNQSQYAPQYSAQPAPQFVASFYQNQADRYVASGYIPPQQDFEGNPAYRNENEQFRQDMYVNQHYDYSAQAKRISQHRSGKMRKKNVNADMIKIVVTIMVVALLICGLLIANQFISGSEAAAEDLPQAIDSQLVASAASENGSTALQSVETLPAYEYEQSTNWFDKVCDFFGGKLN